MEPAHVISSKYQLSDSSEDVQHGGNDSVDSPVAAAEQLSSGNIPSSKWEASFKRLLAFREEHGHCRVPHRYPKDPRLGAWVSTQRRQYKLMMSDDPSRVKSSSMTPERVRLLEEIGFQWSTKDPRRVPWEQRYGELVEFVQKYGHAQVPIGWKENVQLSNWVSAQRQEYKLMLRGKVTRLTPERIELLDKVNFIWEAQRGGPRRKKRATVCVPAKATPARRRRSSSSSPLARRARRKQRALLNGTSTASAAASANHEPESRQLPTIVASGYSSGLSGSQLLRSGASTLPPASSTSVLSRRSEELLASYGLLANRRPASRAHAVGSIPQAAQVASAARNTQLNTQLLAEMQGVSPLVSTALQGQISLPFSSVGTLQGQNAAVQLGLPAQSANMVVLPVATPLPITAAGYQLAMVPSSVLQQPSLAPLTGGVLSAQRQALYQHSGSPRRRRAEDQFIYHSDEDSSDDETDSE